jgi:AraC-like DNA-binding protein
MDEQREPRLTFAGDEGRPQPMAVAHQHPEIELNYFLDGSLTYLIRGSLVTIPARRLAVFWATVPHQTIHVEATRFYWFTVPLAWIFQWKFPATFTEKLLDGALIIDEQIESDAVDCARWREDLSNQDASVSYCREAAQLEIRARLLRLAHHYLSSAGVNVGSHQPPPTGAHRRVERIARFITDNYLSEIAAADIARAAGLNVNYASTLFRRHCGMSPSDYLTMHRVYHAHRLLCTTEKKVIEVAYESGFRSTSRFYDAFEKTFHCQPKKVRTQ